MINDIDRYDFAFYDVCIFSNIKKQFFVLGWNLPDKNREKQEILLPGYNKVESEKYKNNMKAYILGAIVCGFILSLIYFFYYRLVIKQKDIEYSFILEELEKEKQDRQLLKAGLQEKQNEIESLALALNQKSEFLEEIKVKVLKSQKKIKDLECKAVITELYNYVDENNKAFRDGKSFGEGVNKYSRDFLDKMEMKFPCLTEMEKRLITLLKLEFTSREIALLLNVTTKTVEVYRSKLRKKLNIDKNIAFVDFLSEI